METLKIIVAVVGFIILFAIGMEVVTAALSAVLRVIFDNWYWLLGAVVVYFVLNRKE